MNRVTDDPYFHGFLKERFSVRVVRTADAPLLRSYDADTRVLQVDAAQPSSTRAFQMAYQAVSLALEPLIRQELDLQGGWKPGRS